METVLEASNSTNHTPPTAGDVESLTPDRPTTPDHPPPPPKPDETVDNGATIKSSTFKNIQQAKKRLQAFSVQKLNQLPTSPLAKRAKIEERIDETAKKLPKKHKDPNEKAKAVIEEIEEMKRNEQAYLETVRASIDKEHFKKIEKKSRNIRKRSPSLERSKKHNDSSSNNNNNHSKERRRYPKNWRDFREMRLDFAEFHREFEYTPPKGHNDLTKQLLFETPPLPIVQTKIKTLNREDKTVPFQYVRYTKNKPTISYSINFNTIKEKYLNRKTIFETVPKEHAANIEKLYTNSFKFKTDYYLKIRNWFPKSWKDYTTECKLLENSVGLSFLQSYTEDEDNETATNHKSPTKDNNNDDNNNNNNKKVIIEKKKKRKSDKKQKKHKDKSKKKKRIKEKKHKHKSNNIDKQDNNVNDDEIKPDLIEEKNDENLREINQQINEEKQIKTPDTEDYHSRWESDEDLTATTTKPIRPTIKLNRSWESDEELFERSGNNDNISKKTCDFNNLEIPLNLTNLITRKNDNNNDNNNVNTEIVKPVNLNLDLDIIKTDNNNSCNNLENQYEEFMKAVNNDTLIKNQSQDGSSSSSSSESSTTTSSSSDSSTNTTKKKKKKKKYKKTKRKCNKIKDIFNEFDIPVPSDLPEVATNPNNILPLPVPSPDQSLLSSSTATTTTSKDGIDLNKPFIFPTITIQTKKTLIDNSKLKLNDDSDSCDFTEKFLKKSPEPIDEIKQQNEKLVRDKPTRNQRKYRNKKPLRRRYSSPLLRRCSPKRRRSPMIVRRRSLSPPRRRSLSPRYRRRSPLSPQQQQQRRNKRTPSPQQSSRKRVVSPINSPLDGFKKSVADSTISDDMLPQPPIDDYSQSPIYNAVIEPVNHSPRRISLDDRINQVLGIEKNYDNYNYQYEYYGQYTQNYTNYNLTPVQQQHKPINTTKVVQVGNILQVVPTDDVPIIENKPETCQKIVQVGNMLQIVPAVIQPNIDNLTTTTTTSIETTPIVGSQNDDNQIVESPIKLKKAEREKRRLERMKRRKDKEKKRKEREKRRQLKTKLKTENMIKKALQLESDVLFDDDDEGDPTQWPPIQVVVSTSSDTPNKGILLTGGFSRIDAKKSVQFADGIRPGEGTSPSGGEELSSPPPQKPKRHKKIKIPKKAKKKKIKVKVKRIQQQQQQQQQDDEDGGDDDEFENLPPPSPPPGSPPPHVFPSRVKEPQFNNINPYIVANSGFVAYPRPQLPPPPPPQAVLPPQVVMNRPPYMSGSFHTDVHHNSFPGTNHGVHH